jgi:Fe(3+) dicitrate transport protein
MKGYFVADAVLRYGIPTWKSTITVSVKNLTDARYIASRRPQGIKMAVPSIIVVGMTCVL